MISASKISLLIIEDNPGDFILIEDYLKEEIPNVSLAHAETFSSAKKYLAGKIKYDAILLDLSLPDGQGEKLVKEILTMAGDTPIVVLTGYANKEFGIKTLSIGVLDYLLKDELTAPQLYKSIAYSIERRRINLELKESEEKYKMLFHLSPLPMWVFDVNTYEFLNVNEAAIRHYGYSREEFLSMTIMDIRPKEDIKKVEDRVNFNKTTGIFYNGGYRHLKKNGEMIYVDIQSNLIDFDGRKARLILATDISERIKYVETIEEQNLKFREIAWIQSHVVRAPLARIMGLINLLNMEQVEGLTSPQILDHIFSSATELDVVIRDIVKKAEQIKIKENDEFRSINS